LPFAALTPQERAALFSDAHLRTLPAAFAAIPDPRKRRGQRYDLPFLLTCLVAALLCDCNSLEAVGRWTRDHRRVLARVCGPRQHLTPTGSLYRRLLPRLSVAHVERALASWVQQTRPLRDRAAVALDGKTVRGARTPTQAAPPLLSVSTHTTQETLVQVRVDDKTNEIGDPRGAGGAAPPGPVALRGRVVTAAALHTQNTHTALAQRILDKGGAYLFTVKDNQPRLHAALAAYCGDPQIPRPPCARPRPAIAAGAALKRAHSGRAPVSLPTCAPMSPSPASPRSPRSPASTAPSALLRKRAVRSSI
jgi:hypothetical protein